VVKLCPELPIRGVASTRVRRHVRSVIAMLHNLGKIVIAEGVPDAAEAEWLGEAGADWFEGAHYARPMVALEAAAWLDAQDQRAA
jgi:EAL domain-containing protein (putative c-di-GMP-specific phosphodiesterase class I)